MTQILYCIIIILSVIWRAYMTTRPVLDAGWVILILLHLSGRVYMAQQRLAAFMITNKVVIALKYFSIISQTNGNL